MAESPYGTSLLARDTPANRKLFPGGPFGKVDVAASVCTPNESGADHCPHYHYKEDAVPEKALETPIHLLIASFRDRLCPRTIHNAFTRAKNPKRIFIRIIEQTKAGSDLIDDAGCWDRYCKDYNTNCIEDGYDKQVQTIHVDASKAKGPTDARSKLSAMIHYDFVHAADPDKVGLHPVSANDFCVQTDSHMDFSDDYDMGLIDMFHRTENDYAVLSTYVTDIEMNNKDPKNVPNLCMVQFTSSIRNWGTKECRNLVRPKLTNAMWGAGLSFHRCHAELNVPVDPYLDGVFDGEEGSRGLRFFTHGYDVYTPDKVLVTHDYHTHQSNPVVHTWGHHGGGKIKHEDQWVWNRDIEESRNRAVEKGILKTFGSQRVNMMLGIGTDHDETPEQRKEIKDMRSSRFGVGTRRTLEQAMGFSGIDLRNKRMTSNKCGNLLWVPYEERPGYGVDDTLSRGCADEFVDNVANAENKPVAAANDSSGSAEMPPKVEVELSRARLRALKSAPQSPPSVLQDYGLAGGGLCLTALLAVRFIRRNNKKDERLKE